MTEYKVRGPLGIVCRLSSDEFFALFPEKPDPTAFKVSRRKVTFLPGVNPAHEARMAERQLTKRRRLEDGTIVETYPLPDED